MTRTDQGGNLPLVLPKGAMPTDLSLSRQVNAAPSAATSTIVVLALADSLAPLGYQFGGSPVPFQLAGLTLKLLLVLARGRNPAFSRLQLLFLVSLGYLTLIGLVVDGFNGVFAETALLRYAGFTVSIGLTFALLPRSGFAVYCSLVAVVPTAMAGLHVGLAQAGLLATHAGRAFYLGNAHPNLGGEIAAIAAVAAALGMRLRWFLPVAAVLAASALVSQARSALVVIVLVVLARLLSIRQMLAIGVLVLLAAAIVLLSDAWGDLQPVVDHVSRRILLIDDPFRGLGSGFVGRDEKWMMAFGQFLAAPVFGSGIGLFDLGLLDSPHNAFLFSLVHHGLLAGLIWAPACVGFVRIVKSRPREGAIVLSTLVLLVFNDRFINLNTYPFLLYVVLLCHPAAYGRAADPRGPESAGRVP